MNSKPFTNLMIWAEENIDRLRKAQEIGNALRSCETKSQVHRIMNNNRYFFEDNQHLYKTAELALKRIDAVRREKNKTYEKQLN